MLKLKLLLLAVLFIAVNAAGQQFTDNTSIDYTQYKGKLLVVNEFHSVGANVKVYDNIIKKIAATASPGDTLNLILEMPYSQACLINKYIQGDTQLKNPKTFVRSLRDLNIPIRVIGADFEYDGGKRGGELYSIFMKNMAKEFRNNKVPSGKLEEYIAGLKQDTVWQKEQNRKEVAAFYIGELKNYPAGTPMHRAITELVFVLQAKHYISSRPNRDHATYRRLLEAQGLGLIKYNGRYNLLIHGAQHTGPQNTNDIYNHFFRKNASPFKNNCFSIAQVYVNCISGGDYFGHKPTKGSNSILCGKRRNNALLKYVSENYGSRCTANSVTCLQNMDGAPGISSAQEKRIVCWYIQWETE